MVKNKRLLTALIVIVVLTMPRFLFVEVKEYTAEYFDDNNMPDGPDDMPNWQAMRFLVCEKCIEELTELQKKRMPSEDTKRIFYHAVYHDVIRRCPVHPGTTLNKIVDFDWGTENADSGKQAKIAVPESISLLYPAQFRSITKEQENDKPVPLYICQECQKEISGKISEMVAANSDKEELKALAQKLALLEPVEGVQGKLFYGINEIKDFYCSYHPQQKMEMTARLPVHPAVRQTLPEDTKYITRMYIKKDGSQWVDMTIVTAGKDRRSIHRPERCLQMQDYTLRDRRPITIRLSGGKTKNLKVMKLRMERTQIDTATKERKSSKLIVFYWYVSVERMTESNFRLMLYWAWDRLILGKNYHWSYVLLTSPAAGEDSAEEERVTKGMYTFVQEFFPKVER